MISLLAETVAPVVRLIAFRAIDAAPAKPTFVPVPPAETAMAPANDSASITDVLLASTATSPSVLAVVSSIDATVSPSISLIATAAPKAPAPGGEFVLDDLVLIPIASAPASLRIVALSVANALTLPLVAPPGVVATISEPEITADESTSSSLIPTVPAMPKIPAPAEKPIP